MDAEEQAIDTMMNKARWTHLLALATAALTGGCVVVPADGPYYGETVWVSPPPPRVEYRGVPPVQGYIWIDGYWGWRDGRHMWNPGRWEAPRPGYRWVPHRWDRDGRGWREHGGRWER